MPKIIDITGVRFGRLVVLRRTDQRIFTQVGWECRCDCGTTVVSTAYRLMSGRKKSCGCLITEARQRRIDAGVKRTPEYHAWSQAKARCNSPTHFAFKWYGARGIRMSEAWASNFRTFLADMGPRPTEGKYTLDRIDNTLGYQQGNCRWVTFKVQQNNRRSNVLLDWHGENKTVAQWCDALAISRSAVYQRLADGWSTERALTEPVRHFRR